MKPTMITSIDLMRSGIIGKKCFHERILNYFGLITNAEYFKNMYN